MVVMRKSMLQSIILLVVLLLTVSVFTIATGGSASATEKPMDQLQVAVDDILKILQSAELKGPEKKDERHQLVLNIVADMFDFREMARSSLGQSWNTLTPEEKDTFVGLFTTLVEQRYIGKIDSYNNQKVVYKKQLVKGDKAMVYTAIIDKDLEIPIVYRLAKNKGKWLINDLKIENVSLIVNYRRDFDSIIRKEQFAGLVEKISKQLEKPEASN
ncbi:MAG: organic solvent tolerance ABC transporter substrate-binding protein [Desulfobulbaceae bacterium]|nr:MAG: organic solvent tolerance ABC transporter substrate-binding protein [Desulfobulbaceae bacterium]